MQMSRGSRGAEADPSHVPRDGRDPRGSADSVLRERRALRVHSRSWRRRSPRNDPFRHVIPCHNYRIHLTACVATRIPIGETADRPAAGGISP